MTRQAKLVIGVLTGLVLILAVALGVAFAARGDDDHGHMNSTTDSYMGMMVASANMDSDQMLTMMNNVLGPDAYQRMLAHIAAHRAGQTPGDSTVDSMMHQIMDGMMQRMPADRGNVMPFMH
jgi:hypothetical protein